MSRARETREVMRALSQLPNGLPSSLWGWDMTELSRAIVDGERRTLADGTELVLIKGRWYNADRGNAARFMRESKDEEVTRPERSEGPSKEELARRLEQLETSLLEGRISEETYLQLKSKYERRI